jgi:hypothetical protein
MAGVQLDDFLMVPDRRTFTYCKPLVLTPGKPPLELSRLDSKNWSAIPEWVQARLVDSVARLSAEVDAMILLDQVDLPETGVITTALLQAVSMITDKLPNLLILADSRRGLRGFPKVTFKMNSTELALLTGNKPPMKLDEIQRAASDLSRHQQRTVLVTLAEAGILGASPDGICEQFGGDEGPGLSILEETRPADRRS